VDATTGYRWQYIRARGTSLAGNSYVGDGSAGLSISWTNALRVKGKLELSDPDLASPTMGIGFTTVHDNATGLMELYQTGHLHPLSTAYDGMSLRPSAGTFSGSLKVVKVA